MARSFRIGPFSFCAEPVRQLEAESPFSQPDGGEVTEAQGHHCEGAERSAEQTQPWGSLVEKAVVMFRRLEFGFPWRRLSDAWINRQPNGNGMLGPFRFRRGSEGVQLALPFKLPFTERHHELVAVPGPFDRCVKIGVKLKIWTPSGDPQRLSERLARHSPLRIAHFLKSSGHETHPSSR